MLCEKEVGRSRKLLCRKELETFFGLVGRLAIVVRENAKPDLSYCGP